ncbi:DUF2147 domain-containing protein [Ovoidimarina sediminis]|uniref:DUF2147 domain-containing protein n=1 Tax=Ovoidimarina sediminis TaxID=3079856 RepID=UPI002913A19E|nr:DUF2147 domain-containing protein [Rhodophyticola sp. MJ-SS7]MDU8944836.1 DUF2147 domain-containing protein [Rhodophyticola sp. MJ-SS7]
MKILTAAALSLVLSASVAVAEPVIGTWQTEADDNGNFGHVEIAACGAVICGVIVRAYDSAGQPRESQNIGKRMIWDMEAKGEGSYTGGRIWAPDRDKVYRSKMSLDGDRLKVSGCVGPICRGQTWLRVQ